MNSRSLILYAARCVSKALFVAAFALSTFAPIARADDAVNRPYDWLINIQVQQLSRQFQYPSSTLTPVTKAVINYMQDSDPNKQTNYEYMWYCDKKPLGLEKQSNFNVRMGDAVAINLTTKETSPTAGELRAATNAIVHLVLDSVVNRNSVALIKVPANTYNEIVAELQAEQFVVVPDVDPDTGSNSTGINIFVASDPAGMSSYLIHY